MFVCYSRRGWGKTTSYKMTTFQTTLHDIIKSHNYSEKDIAHIFGCSIPTVKRWLAGTNEPPKSMQPHILESLHAFANNK